MDKPVKLVVIPPDAPKNEHGIPVCPECGKFDFKSRAGLGGHRKAEHGVPGTAPQYVLRRDKQAAKTTKPRRNEHGVLPCPECGSTLFTSSALLGAHRKKVHGVPGTSAAATYHQRNKEINASIPPYPPDLPERDDICTHCTPPKRFKNHLGLTIHQATRHGIKGVTHMPAAERKEIATQRAITTSSNHLKVRKHDTISNGHSPEISRSTEPPLTAEDLLVFQTAGELKGHCRFIAESAGIATTQFTARVILALHSQTRR